MTSAYLLEKAMISNDDVSIADWKKSRISNHDVSISLEEAMSSDDDISSDIITISKHASRIHAMSGSNVTDLASNRDLTRDIWSLQVDAPAILHRRDHLMVFTFVLPTPATNAGALPAGPPPYPGGSNKTNQSPNSGGSNVTDLASNRDLTRDIWSLQVDAPAILHRRDHLMVFTFVLPTPATNAGALPAGPPPYPGGSNKTNQSPNRARTKENERLEGDARDTHKHTLHGVRHQAIGSTTIPPLRTTTSHS
ncbi:hypothetical protein F511_40054 [Dorcoceras hygrometricum]|uniref:Uncharacterized protein n=1 Tax=Dorcoceras hygrometricum TaxID=472368 RepID=A0A2Z7CSA9_9LAMI|nr:hypothetical protein F511_40054 [Dorcoceras hygrometricum]